jgi:dihydroorotase
VLDVFRAAAAHGASVHVHVRDLEEPLWYLEVAEVIGASAATGAPGHLVHLNSSMGDLAPGVLDLLRGARVRGVDVSTEAYPYTAAMTEIEAAMFDDFGSWPDARFRRYEWPATGERLTRESFARYRRQGGRRRVGARHARRHADDGRERRHPAGRRRAPARRRHARPRARPLRA